MLHRFSLALAVAQLAVLTVSPAAAVPIQWGVNGHYYELRSPTSTWELANADANAASYLGAQGYLVTFSSAEEESFVMTLAGLNTSTRLYIGLWLQPGGSLTNPNDYHWVTGEAMTYTNWGPGQPDNVFLDSTAATMYFSSNLMWQWDNSSPSFGPFAYVVEYEPAAGPAVSGVPEPGTWALTAAGLAWAARRRLEEKGRSLA